MERLPAAVDPRLRDGARQCAALLHRPVDHRALRGHHPGQSFPAAARGGLVGRALSRVPLGDSNRPTARAVPRLRREVEPLAMLVPGWPLALFRVAFGLLYLDMALQKAPWINFGWLRGFIEQEIEHPAIPVVAALFKSVVLPNFTFFGYMTFVVELALGLGLLLGLLTRLAGIGGFLWQVNIALGAFNVPGEWYWIWVLLTLPQFCFAFSAAGRVWGLDALLRPWLVRTGPTAWSRLLLLAS